MKTVPNEPVNPVMLGETIYTKSNGLTKRELFAAMVLQGFAASPGDSVPAETYPALAACAVKWANALIEALNKEQPK